MMIDRGLVRSSLRALMLVSLFSLAAGSSLTAHAASPGCSWNPATDFRLAPNNANPNPDSCGDAAVWSYKTGVVAHSPSNYWPMSGFDTSVFGTPGVERWWDPARGDAGNHIPEVAVNNSASAITSPTYNWPPGSMMVHPFPSAAAVLEWTSPVTEMVTITGGLRSIDRAGGSGITWYVDMGSTTLASGAYPDGGSQTFSEGSVLPALAALPMTQGTVLYFVVACAADGGCNYDSTVIDLTIQSVVPSANVPEAPMIPLLLVAGAAGSMAALGLRRIRSR